MKLKILALLLTLSWSTAGAQEYLRSSQYIFNNFLLNPALSGMDSYIDLKVGHRQQWSGIDGAPTSQYISINAPIGDEEIRSSINSFSGRGYNPLSRSIVDSYTAAEPHHGFGLIANTEKGGLVRQNSMNATYAYHLGLTSDVNMSFGVSGGINSLSFNVEDVKAESEVDPLFGADYNNRIRPDLGFGVWIYGPRLYVGASIKQVLGQRNVIRDNKSVAEAYQKPTMYATTGVKLFLDEEIAMIPSLLVSYWSNAPAAVDLNMKFAYQDIVWLAGSYRYNDAFSFMAGINVSSLVNLTYSYDMSTSAVRRVNRGTHEIGLGFLLNNTFDVKCSTRQF